MTHVIKKLQKVLVGLGIAGAAVFQVGGCDTAASTFFQGIQDGYAGVTGSSLAEDLGKELAGGSSGAMDVGFGDDWGTSCDYGDFEPTGWPTDWPAW